MCREGAPRGCPLLLFSYIWVQMNHWMIIFIGVWFVVGWPGPDAAGQERKTTEQVPSGEVPAGEEPGSAVTEDTTGSTLMNQLDGEGRRTGPWRVEYPDGDIRYEATFVKGRPVGEMVRYYENGAVQARMDFDSTADRSYTRLYYENGKIAAEGWFAERDKDSVWTYYSEFDGTVRIREPYHRGKLQGKVKNYYPSGEVSEEVTWDRHQKEGEWKQYYRDGSLRLESSYKDDRLDGPYRVYYPDSTLKVSGSYEENRSEGKWEFFDESGNLLYAIEYEHGKPVDQEEFLRMMQDSLLRFQEIQDSLLQLQESGNPDAFRPF